MYSLDYKLTGTYINLSNSLPLLKRTKELALIVAFFFTLLFAKTKPSVLTLLELKYLISPLIANPAINKQKQATKTCEHVLKVFKGPAKTL